MLARMWRKGKALTLLVGMKTGIAILEDSLEVPQEVKNRATLRPNNSITGDLPQIYRCNETKGHLYPNVHRSNFHSSQTVERAEMSINR